MAKHGFSHGILQKKGHSGSMVHKGKGAHSLVSTPSNVAALGGKNSAKIKKA